MRNPSSSLPENPVPEELADRRRAMENRLFGDDEELYRIVSYTIFLRLSKSRTKVIARVLKSLKDPNARDYEAAKRVLAETCARAPKGSPPSSPKFCHPPCSRVGTDGG